MGEEKPLFPLEKGSIVPILLDNKKAVRHKAAF